MNGHGREWKYKPAQGYALAADDVRSDDESGDSLITRPRPKTVGRIGSLLMRIGGLALVATNTILLLVLLVARMPVERGGVCTEHAAAAMTSVYSPLLEPVVGAIEYETRHFQGGFASQSLYKGQPNKALDDAWQELTHASNMSVVDGEVLDRMGIPRTAARYSDTDGGKYVVLVEVFHQLHCLNVVRMYTYADYYDLPENRPLEFTDKMSTLRLHVDHCIDILRQVLMCQADVGLVPFYWVKGQGMNEDFSTPHRCRKLERVVEWADRNPEPSGEPVPQPDSKWFSELPP